MDAHMVELMESGCSLIVGMVTAEGAPIAGRGWGVTIEEGGARCRLLADASMLPLLHHDDDGLVGMYIAVTGCDILTYRALQLKGPVVRVEAATGADRERSAAFRSAFFDNIHKVDHILLDDAMRMAPVDIVAIVFDIVELYDQAPGPNAGAAIAR